MRPATLDDMIDHTVCRVLDLFDIHVPGPRWEGMDHSLDT
jgi:4-hydroxy-3-polyprenylbenzoate decarboxylase